MAMFGRFTERAQKSILLAQEEAKNYVITMWEQSIYY